MIQNVQPWRRPFFFLRAALIAALRRLYRPLLGAPSIGTGGTQAAVGQAAQMADGGALGGDT